jgi:carbon monoxide dehydrogenase subunit G
MKGSRLAIEISEKMQVDVPLETAWAFVTDARRVAACMPGAEIVEEIDERTYVGKAKVKLGAITTAYKGQVVFAQIDAAARSMRIEGEGRETGGGTAKGSLDVKVSESAEGGTELTFDVRVDITGKVMQMGRGMIKGVSAQLFKQFSANAKAQLLAETSGGPGTDPSTAPGAASSTGSDPDEALAVGALLGRTLWQMVVDFFRRLFGKTDR